MKKVLVIEDDPNIVDLIEIHLTDLGCTVSRAEDGMRGIGAAEGGGYDLIILDLMLPYVDGLEVCRRLRMQQINTPILMLTAKSEEIDKVLGLETGADDYLTKPFEMDELFARLRSLLRRRGRSGNVQMEAAGIAVDPVDRVVSYQGETLVLTAREYAILEILVRNAGRFVSRARLEEGIYSWGEEVGSNTVEVYISRLRKRFGSQAIETMRGVGYRISA